jgi:hypothetical protein
MDGSVVAIVNGYPTRDSIRAAMAEGSIVGANSNVAGRFREIDVGTTTVQFQLNGAGDRANCYVQYVQPANANAAPAITARLTGCP